MAIGAAIFGAAARGYMDEAEKTRERKYREDAEARRMAAGVLGQLAGQDNLSDEARMWTLQQWQGIVSGKGKPTIDFSKMPGMSPTPAGPPTPIPEAQTGPQLRPPPSAMPRWGGEGPAPEVMIPARGPFKTPEQMAREQASGEAAGMRARRSVIHQEFPELQGRDLFTGTTGISLPAPPRPSYWETTVERDVGGKRHKFGVQVDQATSDRREYDLGEVSPDLTTAQREYEVLVAGGMSKDEARQVAFGKTVAEQARTAAAGRPPQATPNQYAQAESRRYLRLEQIDSDVAAGLINPVDAAAAKKDVETQFQRETAALGGAKGASALGDKTGKMITKQDVALRAKRLGVTEAEATKRLKAAGYTVLP